MATTGFSIVDWLAKPENQNLLAGMGAKLDPTGVGGALGGATIAYNQSNLAADRAAKQEAAQAEQRTALLDVLKRIGNPEGNILTPKGQPGPTSVSANNDGSIKITADLPGGPGSTANQLATQQAQPTPAISPAGNALINGGTEATPMAMPGTTVTAAREPEPAPASAPVTDPYSRNLRPFDLRSVIPFY